MAEIDPNLWTSLARAYLGGINAPSDGQAGRIAVVNAVSDNLEYLDVITIIGADSAAAYASLEAALAALTDGDTLILPKGRLYAVTTPIVVTELSRITIEGRGSTISSAIDASSGSGTKTWIEFDACEDLTLRDLAFDGTGEPTGAADSSRRLVLLLSGCTRARVEGCKFRNLVYINETEEPAPDNVEHAIYLDGGAGLQILRCIFDGTTGAAVFFNGVSGLEIAGCEIDGAGWYPLHCRRDAHHVKIHHNMFGASNTPDYGGHIDCMGYVREAGLNYARCTDWEVAHNTIRGESLYGAGIRLGGIDGVRCHHNDIAITFDGSDGNGIALYSTESDADNYAPPCANVSIHNNRVVALQSNSTGIGCSSLTDWSYGVGENWEIRDNTICSDGTHYWGTGISIFTAEFGAVEDFQVSGNRIHHSYQASGDCGIQINGTSGGLVTKGRISGNRITSHRSVDSNDVGIFVIQYAEEIEIYDNSTVGCIRGVLAQASTLSEIDSHDNRHVHGGAGYEYVTAIPEFAANAGVPEIRGRVMRTSVSHINPTTITRIDDAAVGTDYTIVGNDGANATTISTNAPYIILTGGSWTGAPGTPGTGNPAILTLRCVANRMLVEISRVAAS
jgi:hypothetical protein